MSKENFGAVYSGSTQIPGFRAVPADGYWANDPPPGASISADGSTVAWMGEDVGEQARMLPAEQSSSLYTEPLWRRIAPGSETPTERVTGGSDPADPICLESGEAALPLLEGQSASDPCLGPFRVQLLGSSNGSSGIWSEVGGGGEANYVPRLSANGEKVAFLSSAMPLALGVGFGGEPEGEPADLYVASMQPGLTRDQALTPLTQIGGQNVAADSPITDFDISPDGRQVAFTTRRNDFPLGSPAPVSAPLAEPGESELFDVDLDDDTLTRVTHGYDGEPSEQTHGSVLECAGSEDAYCNPITVGAQSPSFSANGVDLAFSSTASNLVYGDGNSARNPFGKPEGDFDGSDVFLVERLAIRSLPTPQYVSPAPNARLAPQWTIAATALSRRDGSVLLYVAVPGAGTLAASAFASVPLRAGATSARDRRMRRGARGGHGARADRALDRGGAVASRMVASAHETVAAGVAGGEILELVLRLAKPYATFGAGAGLSADVHLALAAAGHPIARTSIGVRFVNRAHAAARNRFAKSRKGHR